MANYTPTYTLSHVTIKFNNRKIPFLRVNVNIPGLQVGDVIEFGNTFSTDIYSRIQGIVTACGIYHHDVPINPWNFTNGEKLQTGDNYTSATTDVHSYSRYGDIQLTLKHYDGGTWRTISYGGTQTNGYEQNDNYYCSLVFLIYDERTDKYLWFSRKSGFATIYNRDNPGIVNDDNTPVSLITGTAYNRVSVPNYVEIGGFVTLTGIDLLSTDPYDPGGASETGGGTGDFDGTSVDVDFTALPTLSAVDTGFITLYNPSLAQLQSLASYMWSGLFDLDTFKKLFADPMQAILGLSIVPGPVPNGGTQNVRIGNIDSGISMTKAAAQYIDIDCGTLNVEEFWGAYLDYEPYTKAEIFLPFIGVHQISIDDIMNKPVHIKYHIDLLSGGCACEIKCGGSVLYTFIGSCAVSIPVTGSDWTNLINGVLSAASAIGTMVATGGASAPAAVGTLASTAVNSLKPSIEKSGSIAGAGGLLAGKVPVLILTRPRQALPGRQNTFTGYPAFITRSLGDLSGYTEVHSIRLSGIDGTEAEIDEIEELLKGGVIL